MIVKSICRCFREIFVRRYTLAKSSRRDSTITCSKRLNQFSLFLAHFNVVLFWTNPLFSCSQKIQPIRWRYMANINSLDFAFDDCSTGVHHKMFSRTSLNKLLNNRHIQNINCSKNWCRYCKDMGFFECSGLAWFCKWKPELLNVIARWHHLCYIFVQCRFNGPCLLYHVELYQKARKLVQSFWRYKQLRSGLFVPILYNGCKIVVFLMT